MAANSDVGDLSVPHILHKEDTWTLGLFPFFGRTGLPVTKERCCCRVAELQDETTHFVYALYENVFTRVWEAIGKKNP